VLKQESTDKHRHHQPPFVHRCGKHRPCEGGGGSIGFEHAFDVPFFIEFAQASLNADWVGSIKVHPPICLSRNALIDLLRGVERYPLYSMEALRSSL